MSTSNRRAFSASFLSVAAVAKNPFGRQSCLQSFLREGIHFRCHQTEISLLPSKKDPSHVVHNRNLPGRKNRCPALRRLFQYFAQDPA